MLYACITCEMFESIGDADPHCI